MKFDFSSTVGGVTLRDVRRLLRKINRCVITSQLLSDNAAALGLPLNPGDLGLLIAELKSAGYICDDGDLDGEPIYRINDLALRLAATPVTKRFDRPTADLLVSGLTMRARAINNDAHTPMIVARIRAFGSYLTDTNDLGDIDLAVDLFPREDADCGDEIAYGATFGPRRGSTIDRLFRCHTMLLARLRANRKRLSFHERHVLDQIQPSLKTIFLADHASIPRFVRHPGVPADLHAGKKHDPAMLETWRRDIFG